MYFFFVEPSSWYKEYPHCSGRRQSPIDFHSEGPVTSLTLKELEFSDSYSQATSGTVNNNGHSGNQQYRKCSVLKLGCFFFFFFSTSFVLRGPVECVTVKRCWFSESWVDFFSVELKTVSEKFWNWTLGHRSTWFKGYFQKLKIIKTIRFIESP